MNKGQFINEVANKANISVKESAIVINSALEVIAETLKNRDRVTITGFGTFKTNDRAAKKGRNPQTGESINIAATTVPVFKAGSTFKNAIK